MVAALETHAVTPLNKLVQQLPNILAEIEVFYISVILS